jgi:hypothetical protein
VFAAMASILLPLQLNCAANQRWKHLSVWHSTGTPYLQLLAADAEPDSDGVAAEGGQGVHAPLCRLRRHLIPHLQAQDLGYPLSRHSKVHACMHATPPGSHMWPMGMAGWQPQAQLHGSLAAQPPRSPTQHTYHGSGTHGSPPRQHPLLSPT